MRNRLAFAALVVIVLVALTAIVGPMISPYGYTRQDLFNVAQPPTTDHWLGTDALGRDFLTRIMMGGRTAFLVAVLVTGITATLGVAIGAFSAYRGGLTDGAIMRATDVIISFSHLLLAMFVAGTVRPQVARVTDDIAWLRGSVMLDYLTIFGALAVVSWPGYARLMRGQVLSLRQMEFEEIAELTEVIRSGQLGRHGGTKVAALERAFAARYGVRHAIAVSSGSAAVHTAVAAIDPEPGDEIVTTPCSDFGTILGILFQNAIPVFADLDPETLCLDPASVEARITDRTRAILAVHLFGGPADLDALRTIAARHRIPLIEDCAQAQLSEHCGRLAGTIGDLGCFSLNSSKHLNAGEGGMVITDDDALARRARLFTDKAWPRDEADRYSLFLGQNYRLGELQAAVALVGLRRLDDNVAARRRAVDRIRRRTADVPGLRLPAIHPDRRSSYWIFHLFAEPGLDVDRLAAALRAEGIPFTARYVTPLYTWPVLRERRTYGRSGFPFDSPYSDRPLDYAPGLCPVFEAARERLLLVSVAEQWTDADADDVATALRKVFSRVAAEEGMVARAD